jgi:recombination protein RecA
MALAAKINKEQGEGSIVVGSQMRVANRFPSGSLSLDVALGGGWPGNQWIEVVGMESHGKTLIVLKTIAHNQSLDPDFTVLWIAAEHYDVEQAEAMGVDNERVLVIPTQEMEFAYQTMLDYAASRAVDCIVLDSYPALIANEEAAKDMDQAVMALGARLTGKFFRKAGSATKRSMTGEERPILGIIINQYRDAIGQFSPHGTPKTTPGGKAKNFAFYVRVEVKRDEWIEEARPGKGKVKVGQVIKIQTIKNKSAAPQQIARVRAFFREAPFLGFSRGDYDVTEELYVMGMFYGVINRRGRYYDALGRTWDKKDALLDEIRADLGLQEQLTKEVMAVFKTADAATSDSPEEE